MRPTPAARGKLTKFSIVTLIRWLTLSVAETRVQNFDYESLLDHVVDTGINIYIGMTNDRIRTTNNFKYTVEEEITLRI